MSDHPVVVAYRGPDSSGAVQLGAALAVALSRPLLLASAYHHEIAVLPDRPEELGNERRFEAAQAQLQRACRLVPDGIELHEEVVPADGIPESLCRLAAEEDAAVLVLGRDFDGHVTRAVLQHAPCPVAVSPFSVPLPLEEPPKRIGVAFDGSPAAGCAVSAATHLAIALDASITVLAAAGDDDLPADADPRRVAARLSESVTADARILHGRPGALLVAASDELDLLVCGSHGRGRVLSAVLGSVSGELVAGAHCPVLVIPPRTRHNATGPLGLTTAGTH